MTALVYDPIYSAVELPAGHRFPILKYRRLYERARSAGVPAGLFHRPVPLRPAQVKSVLCADYIDRFVSGGLSAAEVRKIGFPWSETLVQRTFVSVAGTILAGRLALESGRAVHLAGGYHHAFRDQGTGFCIINDLYLCALDLLQQPGIRRVLIFDCDVHQGDGTAQLAQQNDAVITVSIHGEKNFPFHKQASDWDIGLPKGVKDDSYLQCVRATLDEAIARFAPDAVIYDAGADIHRDDDLGHFDVSLAGVYERDVTVFQTCERLALPVVAVIGGGYQRDLEALVEVHFQLLRAALGDVLTESNVHPSFNV